MATPAERARNYLARGPPYYGTSDFKHAAKLGSKRGGAGGKFDFEKKLWYAPTNEAFVAMMSTRVWTPTENVDGWMVRSLIERQQQQMVNAKMWEERQKAEANKRPELTEEQKEAKMRHMLGVPNDEPGIVHILHNEHRIPLEMIPASAMWSILGPRSGVSNAMRIYRAMLIGRFTGDDFASGRVYHLERQDTSRERRKKRTTGTTSTAADQFHDHNAYAGLGDNPFVSPYAQECHHPDAPFEPQVSTNRPCPGCKQMLLIDQFGDECACSLTFDPGRVC